MSCRGKRLKAEKPQAVPSSFARQHHFCLSFCLPPSSALPHASRPDLYLRPDHPRVVRLVLRHRTARPQTRPGPVAHRPARRAVPASVYPPSQKIVLGLDLKGGTEFLIRLVKDNPHAVISPKAQETAVEVIRSRVDKFGVGEPVISRVGEDQILVQIPGLDTAQINEARERLQTVAKLEFKIVLPQQRGHHRADRGRAGVRPAGLRDRRGRTGDRRRRPAVTPASRPRPTRSRRNISSRRRPTWAASTSAGQASASRPRATSSTCASIPTGAKQFDDIASANYRAAAGDPARRQGHQRGPCCRRTFYPGGNVRISGHFNATTAQNLSSALENPLATPVRIEQERSVSATLGRRFHPARRHQRPGRPVADVCLRAVVLPVRGRAGEHRAGHQHHPALRHDGEL